VQSGNFKLDVTINSFMEEVIDALQHTRGILPAQRKFGASKDVID
jgi:hypothetical protein